MMAPTDKKAVGPFALGAVARNLGRVFPRSPIISHNPCAEENIALRTGVFVWRKRSIEKGYGDFFCPSIPLLGNSPHRGNPVDARP